MIKKQLAVGVAIIGLLLAVAFLRMDSSTPAIFWNGPVVRVTTNLEQALQNRP